MSFNFDSFKAIEELEIKEKHKPEEIKEESSSSYFSCNHSETCIEKDVEFCVDCGEEIKKICESKNTDQSRIHLRKVDEKGIYKDVENMGFSEKIVQEANKIYFEVTKGQIFRGNSRKSIVFASIFHAYKIFGKPQSHDKLISIFNLNKKNGLKGLKYVNLFTSKTYVHTSYITPINLIDEIMDNFQSSDEQKKEVAEIYSRIKNKSSKLNRSRPQSVASGLVYYWIKKNGKDISLKQFIKKVGLSELTINKIYYQIDDILK
jgi:transcription initiation factor TFIIIB Brf1 subunit/transcription initiation factor TFIIB